MPSTQRFRTLCLLVALVGAFLSAPALAQTETILYNFQGGTADGSFPMGGLIADSSGNFYGTATSGGNGGALDGTVYRMTAATGEIEILHYFAGTDGKNPQASLLLDANGNLYGTAAYGGTYNSGVVFELKRISVDAWKYSVLYNFNFDGVTNFDGAFPYSALVMDQAGNIYGTTELGGTGGCYDNQPAKPPKGEVPSGCGIAFKLSPHSDGVWSEEILYNFQGLGDGGLPIAGLVFDRAGNLYGTTSQGGRGSSKCDSYYDGGCGVVFSLTRSGSSWSEDVLYRFRGGSDGAQPTAPLVLDHAGNLYGTTAGADLGYESPSSIFELSPVSGGSWTETTILTFSGNGNGVAPLAGLVFDEAGNLYGTTYYGSSPRSENATPKGSGSGVVFQLTPNGGTWTETVLHSFSADVFDGINPGYGSLLLSKGSFYGTTVNGGDGMGVIYKLVP